MEMRADTRGAVSRGSSRDDLLKCATRLGMDLGGATIVTVVKMRPASR